LHEKQEKEEKTEEDVKGQSHSPCTSFLTSRLASFSSASIQTQRPARSVLEQLEQAGMTSRNFQCTAATISARSPAGKVRTMGAASIQAIILDRRARQWSLGS